MSAEQQSTTIARLQAYLLWSAHRQAKVVSAPPFTIFLPQGGMTEAASAIPNTPVGNELHVVLPALRAMDIRPEHQFRFVFLAEFAPGLARALQVVGYQEKARKQLLTCSPATLRPVPAVPGLAIATLDASSSLADVREGLDANEQGFDPQAARATDADAETFRRELVDNRAFTARLDNIPVGAGMFTPPHDGVAELVGITTLSPFRRRGIGAFLTGYAARTAFALGVDLVYLSTSNPTARRVYDRLGFQPHGTQLTFGVRSNA